MNSEDINQLKSVLIEKIQHRHPELLRQFPIKKYIACLERYPEDASYEDVSDGVRTLCEGIERSSNQSILETYHQIVILELIPDAREKVQSMTLTDEETALYHTNFNRIANDAANYRDSGFYLYSNQSFGKALAFCRLRFIPVGLLKMEISGMSKRVFFKNGPRQFIRVLAFLLFQLRGLKPLYQIHSNLHDRKSMEEFNRDGWARCYRLVAESLKREKHVRGLVAASWFFDPALEQISPRLNYLRELGLESGGNLFYWGQSKSGTNSAIKKSPTRRRLYEEGKYIPTSYMFVWPREKLIKWAGETFPSGTGTR